MHQTPFRTRGKGCVISYTNAPGRTLIFINKSWDVLKNWGLDWTMLYLFDPKHRIIGIELVCFVEVIGRIEYPGSVDNEFIGVFPWLKKKRKNPFSTFFGHPISVFAPAIKAAGKDNAFCIQKFVEFEQVIGF